MGGGRLVGVGLLVLLAPAKSPLEQADLLAATARATKGDRKDAAVSKALDAYAALLLRHGKDRRLVPRIHRRRASLLRHAGKLGAALREHEAILGGRADRMDRARALLDGARLLEAQGKLDEAETRLHEVVRRYRDATRTRAVAALRRGGILEKLKRDAEALRSYRLVVEECRFEEKVAIEAYDALALYAIAHARPRDAHRWLRACEGRFGKRAARGDRKGAFLGRQLAAMKAPVALAKLESAPG
jgi:tetratricopeptide (TPR) repeat protein